MRERAIVLQIKWPDTAGVAFSLGCCKLVIEKFTSDPAVVRAGAHTDIDIHITLFQLLWQGCHFWQREPQADPRGMGPELIKQFRTQHQGRIFMQGNHKCPLAGLRIKGGGGKHRVNAPQYGHDLRPQRLRSGRGQHPTSMWGRDKQRFAKE